MVVSQEMKKLLEEREKKRDKEEVDKLISALNSNQATDNTGSHKKVRIHEPQTTVKNSALCLIVLQVKNPPSASATDKE